MSDTIFKRADGSQRCTQGYKYAAPKADTNKYSGTRYAAADLPSKVDLRPLLTPVEDQGQTSSCVANAVAGAYEYLAKMHTGEDYDVSRMFIYFNGRALGEDGNAPVEDSGCYIQHAIEGLRKYGACSEAIYPFEKSLVNKVPFKEAYGEAEKFKVEDTALVPTDLNAWKSSLAEGHPIIFGINLYKSFDKQPKKGLVPMPSKNEASRASHGGHAMLAVGYSDKDKVFIVRNSWGEGWGDDGYCYIPYDYLVNPKFNDGDSWMIKQLGNTPIVNNEQYWSNDDTSVIGDYASEIANMTPEQYADMLDAMGDDYPFEYRLGLIFLYAASADGNLSDEEYNAISVYLTSTMETMGIIGMSAIDILYYAVQDIENITLIEESISFFGEYFSHEMLAKIMFDIQSVVSIDGSSEYESSSIYSMMSSWQTSEEYSSEEYSSEEYSSEESEEYSNEEEEEEEEEEEDEEDYGDEGGEEEE